MSCIRNSSVLLTAASSMIFGWGHLSASANEVLINGDLELSVAPVSWSIETFITGEPGSSIPSVVEHNDGANNPPPPAPGLGLLLHPQVGNQGVYQEQNKAINFVLEQTFVGAVAGRTYTFKGDVFFQDGYSGVVETLNPLYPRGDYNEDTVVDAADYTVWRNNLGMDIALPNEGPDITSGMVTQEDYEYWKSRYGNEGRVAGPSPTHTTFEIDFLNSSDVVLETFVLDLRDVATPLAWQTTQVQGMSPATTNKVRVRVSALDMVDNCCDKGQDVLFDNFSLRDNVVTGLERLANGNLDTPGEPLGWTLFRGPTVDQGLGPVTADSAAFIGFANRRVEDTEPPVDVAGVPTGNQGLWLRPFVNTTQFNPDIPSVDAIASQVVPGTPGADYTFSAWSAWEQGFSGGLFNTSTETFLRMEFLNGSMSVIGNHVLDLLDAGQMNDDGDNGSGNVDWADWRQFSLNAVAPAGTAHVRVSLGATGMFNSELGVAQSAFFDEMSLIELLPGSGGLAVVPEPTTVGLLSIALGLICVGRRRS